MALGVHGNLEVEPPVSPVPPLHLFGPGVRQALFVQPFIFEFFQRPPDLFFFLSSSPICFSSSAFLSASCSTSSSARSISESFSRYASICPSTFPSFFLRSSRLIPLEA